MQVADDGGQSNEEEQSECEEDATSRSTMIDGGASEFSRHDYLLFFDL